MKIAVSFDHRGAPVSARLLSFLVDAGHELIQVPVCSSDSCDYPDMAYPVASSVVSGAADSETVEIEIANPSTAVTVSTGPVNPSSAVALSGTTTLINPTVR